MENLGYSAYFQTKVTFAPFFACVQLCLAYIVHSMRSDGARLIDSAARSTHRETAHEKGKEGMSTREEYVDQVSYPGKFEGEAPYVPYYWEAYLNGCADRDNGTVLGFDVTTEDRQLFPELKGRRTVRLIETEQGFVSEIR